jgi:hypothetical protein
MDKYRNVKWNNELAVQRERNNERSVSPLRNRYGDEYNWPPAKTNDVPVLKIVIGSAVGLVLVGFVFFGSGLMFTNGIISSVDDHLNNVAKTAQLEIERRNRALAVELERIELQKSEAELQRRRIEEEYKQNLIRIREDQITKEKKWKAFYTKPDYCNSPATNQIRVECGNLYMRARAKFDDLYSSGKI